MIACGMVCIMRIIWPCLLVSAQRLLVSGTKIADMYRLVGYCVLTHSRAGINAMNDVGAATDCIDFDNSDTHYVDFRES